MTNTTIPPNELIRASAGTGKTFQLSNRFLALLLSGVPIDQILATTFTRKAAGEILQRVILRLAQAASSDEHCQQLRDHLKDSIEDMPVTRPQCLELLTRLTRGLHRLRVSTLDSFFAQIARSFSLDLGLPPGWNIVEPLEDRAVRMQAINQVLRGENDQDLVAMVHLLTKGQANRGISDLLHATVDGLYELFQETDAATWKTVPRYKPLEPRELAEVLQQLRSLELDRSLSKARDAAYAAAASGNWDDFLAKGIAPKVLDGSCRFGRKDLDPSVTAIYQRLIDHARSVLVGRVAMQTEGACQLLERFDQRYQQLKHDRRALRFDDVTRSLARWRQMADVDRLSYRLDARISHLLLDEFQDTSLAQWQVLHPLARHVTRPKSARSLFCVGDVKQAIYGWRGGNAEIFDALPGQLGRLQARQLDESFRCWPAVIDTVNRVFAGMTRHDNLDRAEPAVRKWSQQFRKHSAHWTDQVGYVSLETAPPPEEGQSLNDATLHFAARQIARLAGQSAGLDIGVLARKNETVARMIHQLRAEHIRASEEGGNPLTDSAAVQLVLSLLKLADHPGDAVSRFHLATSPLGPELGLERHDDDLQATDLASRVRRALIDDGYGPTIFRWTRLLQPSCDQRETSRLRQLVELAFDFQRQATIRTEDFVQLVETQRVSDPSAADVRVMTVHQAKGLEFDIVVLPELDVPLIGQPPPLVVHRADATSPIDRVCRYANAKIQKLMPEDLQQMFRDAVQREVSESLCVLYVALTRAAHALHMIIAPPNENERKLPCTWAGLLRAALSDQQVPAPETVLYQQGDPQWYHRAAPVPTEPAVADRPPAVTAIPPVIKLAAGTGRQRRGLPSTSPSQLEGGRRVQLADHLRVAATAGMQYGTLIHAWLEQVQWLDEGPPSPQQLREVAERLGVAEQDIARHIPEFHAMLQRPNLARLLSRATYEPTPELPLPEDVLAELAGQPMRLMVSNEQRIATRDGNTVLGGNIDRLVLLYHGDKIVAADVIDYKTDRIDPQQTDAVAAKVDFYRPQLAAYRRAVSNMLRLQPRQVAARLMFLGLDRIEMVQP